MRTITRCPSCETQFFVTEAQLNKHDGKVRCGQCMHVFNAKDQFIDAASSALSPPIVETAEQVATASNIPDIEDTSSLATPGLNAWPAISNHLLDEEQPPAQMLGRDTELVELSASNEEINAFTADNAITSMADHALHDEMNDRILLDDEDLVNIGSNQHEQQAKELNDITKLTFVAGNQGNYFEDLAKKPKHGTKAKKTTKHSTNRPRRWPWLLGVFLLILAALAQTVYFLRNDIAIYYPNAKPYLLQACQKLNCNINLPQQIEFILIDDSDMQEDEKYAGLMHFSSSLINKADFIQAYPNLELTLTDTDDSPVLRRLFKPSEYLPANKDIPTGLQPGEEIKVKLAITTKNIPVAGYRIYVTY